MPPKRKNPKPTKDDHEWPGSQDSNPGSDEGSELRLDVQSGFFTETTIHELRHQAYLELFMKIEGTFIKAGVAFLPCS